MRMKVWTSLPPHSSRAGPWVSRDDSIVAGMVPESAKVHSQVVMVCAVLMSRTLCLLRSCTCAVVLSWTSTKAILSAVAFSYTFDVDDDLMGMFHLLEISL